MKLSKEIIMAAQKKWHRDYLMKNTIKYPAVSYRVPRKQELARKLRNELQSLQRDLERAEEGLSDACRRYNLAKELPILLNAWIPNNVSFPLFWLIKTTSRNMLPGSPFARAAGAISPGELPN